MTDTADSPKIESSVCLMIYCHNSSNNWNALSLEEFKPRGRLPQRSENKPAPSSLPQQTTSNKQVINVA
jgi:hypothetical protein